MNKKGFTLIEVMIVVAIIALLALMAMFMMTNNLAKSRDGKRKTDLNRLKVAFEEYYGDENTYPPDTILSNCGGEGLRPYLNEIPCDPKTDKPYCYIYDANTVGQHFRILGNLEYDDDPIIDELNCGIEGVYCGFEDECTPLGYSRFNYGVSSTNVLVASDDVEQQSTPTPSPSPTSTPLPSSVPGTHACSALGVCNTYTNPQSPPNNCPITFLDDQCDNYCPTSPQYARCAN